MKDNVWMRYLLAAAVILAVGAVWALADETEMKVEVKNEGGQEITVDVNGVTEIITLGDLAPGEERTYDVNGQSFTVKRADDHLTLVHDGAGLGAMELAEGGSANMVWVTEDEELGEGAHKVIVKKRVGDDPDMMFVGTGEAGDHDVLILKDENGEIDLEALKERFGDDFEEIHTNGKRVMTWVSDGDEGGPIVIKTGAGVGRDFAVYRCEETGSVLTVRADENLLDTYIDPVTGCVLKKIEGPGQKVVHVEVITEEETPD